MDSSASDPRTNLSSRTPSSALSRSALGLAFGLLCLQCVELPELSCEDTLSCGEASPAYLDESCEWRQVDGGLIAGGPRPNEQGVWVWSDGAKSVQQVFVCGLTSAAIVDAGPVRDGGATTDAQVDASRAVPPAVDSGLRADGGVQDAGPGPECAPDERRFCGPETDAGRCRLGIQLCTEGRWGGCLGAVFALPRDCGSTADNDCDGLPDNTLDEVCQCAPNTTGPCEEHEGLDGFGPCTGGQRQCHFGGTNSTSAWGECSGAVGPQPADSCSVVGDDSDCNGEPNTDCDCVDGETESCGPEAVGICHPGVRTCFDQEFGECVGEVEPRPRNCRSPEDNDCNGLPDDTRDQECRCQIGESRACEEHPGLDGTAQCRAGRQVCRGLADDRASAFDECIGSVGPSGPDSCVQLGSDLDCSGEPNTGCECVAGQGNAACRNNSARARCNELGQCVACEGSADCAEVTGLPVCTAGVCVAVSVPEPLPAPIPELGPDLGPDAGAGPAQL